MHAWRQRKLPSETVSVIMTHSIDVGYLLLSSHLMSCFPDLYPQILTQSVSPEVHHSNIPILQFVNRPTYSPEQTSKPAPLTAAKT